jgi:acylphosphatase
MDTRICILAKFVGGVSSIADGRVEVCLQGISPDWSVFLSYLRFSSSKMVAPLVRRIRLAPVWWGGGYLQLEL